MVDEIDEFAIKFMGEYDKKPFKNATQEVTAKESDIKEEDKPILEAIKEALSGKVEKVVTTKALINHAVCLSSEGEVSIEMEKVMASMPNADNAIKAKKVLEINENHAIFNKLKTLFNEDKEKFNSYVEVLYAEAALVAGVEVDNIAEIADLIINLII